MVDSVINTEIYNIRHSDGFGDGETYRSDFSGSDPFNTFMTNRFSTTKHFPFAVNFSFYFISTDMFSFADVFLYDTTVNNLFLAQMNSQYFFLTGCLCEW